jgi:hypothetical protein
LKVAWPDQRVGERALEQWREPRLHGQDQLSVRAQRLYQVRQDVSEHHLIAEPLFADDQQGAAGQVAFRRPLRTIDKVVGDVGECRVQPRLVGVVAAADRHDHADHGLATAASSGSALAG